jgi:hypothetical protein
MTKKPALTLVETGSKSVAKPSRRLGQAGMTLWGQVMSEYDIKDSGGLEMLCLACQSLDRAEALREQIDDDGEVIRSKAGIKDHPALKHELAARAFVVKTLHRLGLDVEPIKAVGRPSGR